MFCAETQVLIMVQYRHPKQSCQGFSASGSTVPSVRCRSAAAEGEAPQGEVPSSGITAQVMASISGYGSAIVIP